MLIEEFLYFRAKNIKKYQKTFINDKKVISKNTLDCTNIWKLRIHQKMWKLMKKIGFL